MTVKAATATEASTTTLRAGWKDYLALTKPRVISLLLFTTLAAMYIAPGGTKQVSIILFLAVAVGGYMSAGSANAFNMVIDHDIDGLMVRTTGRPTVTHLISARAALIFAFLMEAGSFSILWYFANLLTASLALAGLLFYVFIYTLLLKRRTWQNIVIGGAAGSFPPLVGYAAVTNNLAPLAWLLFGIIFLWTPVHFWALAILIKDDYERAGVPMLPVVKGDRATVVQIGWYAVVTVAATLMPVFMHLTSWIYLISLIPLNVYLFIYFFRLRNVIEKKTASGLFHYSMIYLALLFLAMAIDRSLLLP
ncbi:MAG: heme o synthase [Chthonomonadales bacterium]